jgi:mannose-6-phosphate isomerase-like protein (cupin superfamily)
MQLFSTHADHTILCDTPLCFGEVQRLPAQTPIRPHATSPAEVVLCVLDGELAVDVAEAGGEDAHFILTAMEGIQIPAGQPWAGQTGAAGAKVLRVESFHPHFAPEQRLMPALAQPHRFAVADGGMLVYTDHIRGGVLNFRPGYAADKHFHQDADELFWFFQGQCRVVTPDGEVLAPAGTVVYTAPGEWHIIENPGPEPLLMFVTVTPNLVPSHTFFDAAGKPTVRSWAPLRGR